MINEKRMTNVQLKFFKYLNDNLLHQTEALASNPNAVTTRCFSLCLMKDSASRSYRPLKSLCQDQEKRLPQMRLCTRREEAQEKSLFFFITSVAILCTKQKLLLQIRMQ
jgi:hypothetical protein